VDLTRGAVYFTGGLAEVAEIHVGEALMRTVGKPFAQASVTLLLPSVLQVTALKGGVDLPTAKNTDICRKDKRIASTWTLLTIQKSRR
jgi:hypothetical protein